MFEKSSLFLHCRTHCFNLYLSTGEILVCKMMLLLSQYRIIQQHRNNIHKIHNVRSEIKCFFYGWIMKFLLFMLHIFQRHTTHTLNCYLHFKRSFCISSKVSNMCHLYFMLINCEFTRKIPILIEKRQVNSYCIMKKFEYKLYLSPHFIVI